MPFYYWLYDQTGGLGVRPAAPVLVADPPPTQISIIIGPKSKPKREIKQKIIVSFKKSHVGMAIAPESERQARGKRHSHKVHIYTLAIYHI